MDLGQIRFCLPQSNPDEEDIEMKRAEAYQQMVHDLEQLQNSMTRDWLKDGLPSDWTGLDYWSPVEKPKTRVTIRLDADMVKWFRALGPGYQTRINLVLRIYYLGLVGGHIKAFPNDQTTPRLRLAALSEFETATGEVQDVVDDLRKIGRGEE